MSLVNEKNQKWWVLVAMTTCVAMIFIDISVLPVALPTIQRTLGLSELGLQWIINGYTLALTVFLLAGGRLGDRYGYRKLFCFGIFTFALSSALCGLSQYEWWFVLSRILQGIGGAMLIPTSSAIIFSSFPPHQRGKAMGLYVSIGSIFLALGPFIGGIFTQYYSWRLVFWINLPIALVGYCLTLYAVPKFEGNLRKFDLFGFFTSLFGISSIVIGLMQARTWGWNSPWTISLVLFGLVLLILLYKIDRRVEDPYIDFSLFKKKTFIGANLSIFCTQFILMITVFWAIYFQNVLGFSPAKAGTLSLISNLPIMVIAPMGGHLLDKYGPRLPLTIGFSVVITSLIWFVINVGSKNLGIIFSAIIPFGCGIPLIFTPSFTTAMAEIPKERRGLASGTCSMLRQLGASLGLATIGTLFLNVQGKYLLGSFQKNTETSQIAPIEFQGLLSKAPEAVNKLQTLPTAVQDFIRKSFVEAYIKGFSAINIFAICIASLGLAFALSLIKKKRVSPPPQM